MARCLHSIGSMDRIGRLLTGIALLLVVCGCGAMATAPVLPGDDGGSPSDTTAAQSPPSRGSQDPIGGVSGALPRLVTRVTNLAGDLGAAVENGRWSVDVPAGAIEGDARIAVTVAYAKSGECTMNVVPTDKNKFDVPAIVTVDCAALSDTQLAQSGILEFDPVNRRWFDVPDSKVDMNHRTVSAPVDHVARYTVGPVGGKAGW
jgi:hypothetical protein